MAQRVGVFGGTFDPPHVGHLVAASQAGYALGLDRVLLVVANLPWQKVGTRVLTSADHRLAMVAAAVDGVARLEASALEVERGGPSYTADTLAELASRHRDSELFLILGADAAAGFPTWDRHLEVASRARLVVVDRAGSARSQGDGVAWQRVEMPALDVSSTELRRRVASSEPIDFLTPPAVVTYIRDRGLYRGG